MERNTLMAQCYPKLKDFCREKHGLEFQVRINQTNNVFSGKRQNTTIKLYETIPWTVHYLIT